MTNDHGNGKATEEMTPGAAAQRQSGPDAARQDAARAETDEQPGADAQDEAEVTLDEQAVEAIEDEEAPVAEDAEGLAEEPQDLAGKYLALAQRTQADFENYRKRASRDAATAQTRGVVKLAKELLPAIDDLDRALAAAQEVGDGAENPLVEGIKLVHADMVAALARVGIEGYSPKGEQFDPQHHEAMAQQPVPGAEPGTIVEVYQRGYALGDTVIRPARVVVAG
jgi:molecular chaperone GrpE